MFRSFVIVTLLFAVSQAKQSSVKDRLFRELLKDYAKGVDPGKTNLELGISYLCARLINKSQQDEHNSLELKSKLWESYKWTDTRLQWNPSEYGDIKELRLPASLIWTPDVKLYNAYDEAESRYEVNALIYSDGTVTWIPPVSYKTYCSGRGDSINCSIKLGSWTYSDNDVQLTAGQFDTTAAYLEDCPYAISHPLIKVESKVYPCCPDESYSHVQANFTLRPRHY